MKHFYFAFFNLDRRYETIKFQWVEFGCICILLITNNLRLFSFSQPSSSSCVLYHIFHSLACSNFCIFSLSLSLYIYIYQYFQRVTRALLWQMQSDWKIIHWVICWKKHQLNQLLFDDAFCLRGLPKLSKLT